MLTNKINDWLNGSQNFIVGRVLYNHLGNDERLKRLLKHGESNTNKKLLIDALQALAQKPFTHHKKINRITDEMPTSSNDVVLIALNNEWKPLYQLMKYKIGQLDQFGSSNSPEAIATRFIIASDVLALEKKINRLWANRDHYLQNGSLPQVNTKEKELPGDPVEAAKHIENIKKNIRKNRTKMNQPGADAKYAELYKKYLSQYEALTGKQYEEKSKK